MFSYQLMIYVNFISAYDMIYMHIYQVMICFISEPDIP